MNLKTFSILLTILYSTNASALFCPGNFNQISLGNSPEQVVLQCGKPDKEKSYKSTPNMPQEWNYYINPNPTSPNSQGTLKMTVAFNDEKKAVNITINGTSLVNSTLCGNAIQLGDTQETIQNTCGKASFVNQSTAPQDVANATEITEYTYNSTPPVMLTFENGKLKDRKENP